ncbi:MAG: response regulator transcription factor [Bacteroidales bacterium]|nr:response regulator transcription factor [Bacteroidales bacterium]
MKIRCLIVDDETLAQDVIEKYISAIPTLELAGKCDSAVEAIAYLHDHPVDLLFLDLNMPGLGGLEMLKTLTNPPWVILTTAYSEYALESYEYGVADYLLKPIKLERFIKAVNKVAASIAGSPGQTVSGASHESLCIFIREDQVTFRINTEDILFVEAYGNYLKVHTPEKTFVSRETMHDMEKKLPQSGFFRVHKSFIVSLERIDRIQGNRIHIRDREIPIGEIYKMALKQRVGSRE